VFFSHTTPAPAFSSSLPNTVSHSEMDSGDELIAQKEIPLEPHISSEQDTSLQKNTHGANEFGESSVRAGETVVGEGHTYLDAYQLWYI